MEFYDLNTSIDIRINEYLGPSAAIPDLTGGFGNGVFKFPLILILKKGDVVKASYDMGTRVTCFFYYLK